MYDPTTNQSLSKYPVFIKSAYPDRHYSFSLTHEVDQPHLVVVVYLKPNDILNVKQLEIGRAFIDDRTVQVNQSKGQFQVYVQEMVQSMVDSYENRESSIDSKRHPVVQSRYTETPTERVFRIDEY